jgi:replicative DNA helicase
MATSKSPRQKIADELTYGKISPHSKLAESAVLGILMLEGSSYDLVAELLQPDCFYIPAHKLIYKAIQELIAENRSTDLLMVSERLMKIGQLENIGGGYYLSKLTQDVVSSGGVEDHAKIIYEKYINRTIIEISGKLMNQSFDPRTDPFDLLDDAEAALFSISVKNMAKGYQHTSTSIIEVIKRIDTLMAQDKDITGVTSGFPSLDRLSYGWQPGNLYILAARPSVGKTAFALNLARNACAAGVSVGFFSLEMSTGELMMRLVTAESGISLDKLSRGKISQEERQELNKSYKSISEIPLYIDDSPALSIYELRSKCRSLVRKKKVGLIIIDYLQLMRGANDQNRNNREQEISKISRDLKGLAKELQIPIIALSQLSREVEKRGDGKKVPNLSDLRDSGAIEQDADMVMFLYRPEYYGHATNEVGESNNGHTDVKVAKNRNGILDTIKLTAKLWIQKFTEYEKEKKPKPGEAKGFIAATDTLLFPAPGSEGSEKEFDFTITN